MAQRYGEVSSEELQGLDQHLGNKGAERPTRRPTRTADSSQQGAKADGQLGLWWSEEDMGVPSSILRSELFGFPPKRKRPYYENVQLACYTGMEMFYKGEALDQGDLDCFAHLVHLAIRQNGIHERIAFSGNQFLRGIHRHTGGSYHKWLAVAMDRLIACRLLIRIHFKGQDEPKEFRGNLVHKAWTDQNTGQWVVLLNAEVAKLFEENYSRLEREIRLQLKRPMEQWLHGYINTQKAPPHNPHRIGLEKLKAWSGSKTDIRDFRRKVREAMEQMARVGVVTKWCLEADILRFVRPKHSELQALRPDIRRDPENYGLRPDGL